jgi:hypothetical protein
LNISCTHISLPYRGGQPQGIAPTKNHGSRRGIPYRVCPREGLGALLTLNYSLEITFELGSQFKVVERGSSLEKRGIQECREGLGALECPVFLSLRRV